MKHIAKLWTLLAVVLLSVVGCNDPKPTPGGGGTDEPSGNGELVSLVLKNVTALSVDAEVLKYKECVRYVAGATFAEAFDTTRFVNAAKNSLNPNESYPYVQYNSATESKTWTEMDLVKDDLTTKEDNTGIVIISGQKYTVAVYAEDAQGNYKVYTETFTAPAAVVDGTVDIQLNNVVVGMNKVTADLTTDSECRIITGYRLAVNPQDQFNADEMTDEEIKTYLAANAATTPRICSGEEAVTFYGDLGIDTDYVIYAIAIKDGKIGNIAYQKVHTTRPELNGKGAVTAATIEEQTDLYKLTYTLTTNEETEKVRIYFTSKVDYNNNKATLDFIMNSEEASYMWQEYDVENGSVTIESEIYVPGLEYAIIAMAFDAEGNPSALTNVVNLWDSEKEFFASKAEEETPSKVDMTGTGEVTLSVKEGTVTEENVTATVSIASKSENVAQAWLYFFYETTEGELAEAIESNLQDWDGTDESLSGSFKPISFIAGETFDYNLMLPYSGSWGGSIVAAVTLDQDGKFSISDYYMAGTGDKNVEGGDQPGGVSGNATLAVEELVNDGGMVNVKAQVTKVADSFEFGWILRFGEIKEADLAASVAAAFENFASTGEIEGSYKEITFGAVEEYNFLTSYDEQWGGSILAVVGITPEGTLDIADYYVAGAGNKGTIVEGGDTPEPGDSLYGELYKGATLEVVTENLADPTSTSATVKVNNVNSAVKTYILRTVGSPATLATMIDFAFEEYDGTVGSIAGAKKEVTESGQEFTYEYMEAYDAAYAEYAVNILVVEVGADNTPIVVAAYCSGEGAFNGTKEYVGGGDTPEPTTPAMTLVSEDVAGGTATFTIAGVPAGSTAWLLNLGSEAYPENVNSDVAAKFADGDTPIASENGAYRIVTEGVEYTFNGMLSYDPKYGGNIIAYALVDAAGNVTVVDFYTCGLGMNGTQGGDEPATPALTLVSENVAGGTATFTVSGIPAGSTAWLLNLGSEAYPNEVSSTVALKFADGETPIATENGAYRIVTEGVEYTFNGMLEYDPKFGGNIIAFALVDAAGNVTVVNFYTCGLGLDGGEGGEEEGEDIDFGGSTGGIIG